MKQGVPQGRNLSLSKDKSTTSIFSTWTNECNLKPKVMVNGTNLLTTRHPNIPGVTFNNQLNLSEHCTKTCDKLQKKRNNVLKKLAGTNWDCSKQTLSVTYKAIGRSVLYYAAPLWTPTLSYTISQRLQIKQNNTFRLTTGCLRVSNITYLYETRILPVEKHNQMLSKQFLLGICFTGCNTLLWGL